MNDFSIGEAVIINSLRKAGIILARLYDANLNEKFQVLFVNYTGKPEVMVFSKDQIKHLKGLMERNNENKS